MRLWVPEHRLSRLFLLRPHDSNHNGQLSGSATIVEKKRRYPWYAGPVYASRTHLSNDLLTAPMEIEEIPFYFFSNQKGTIAFQC